MHVSASSVHLCTIPKLIKIFLASKIRLKFAIGRPKRDNQEGQGGDGNIPLEEESVVDVEQALILVRIPHLVRVLAPLLPYTTMRKVLQLWLEKAHC
jgi:hypothetical protein